MRLQPQTRHFYLLAILVAVVILNIVRYHHAHQAAARPATSSSPGWGAFDHAATLRDAPDPQFTPALDALRAQTENATGPEAADLRGCQMWLLYYRHSVPAAAGKQGDWSMLATSHVQSCLTTHRDVGR